MAYKITITTHAENHLRSLPVREQRIVEAAVLTCLQYQPEVTTRAIKRLRPNPLAEFELRVRDLRVLYNVEESEVVLLVIGRKIGNKLVVAGEEYHGHQHDPTESPGDRPAGDTQ